MSGRGLVLGVIASLIGAAIWHLATRKPKSEATSNFKPWYPQK